MACTHSLSSWYMGRIAGWQTNAKVRMGTAYTVCDQTPAIRHTHTTQMQICNNLNLSSRTCELKTKYLGLQQLSSVVLG